MDYVSFCAAVEPKHGGRDLDNQGRELDKAWKKKPIGGETEDAGGPGTKAAGKQSPRCPAPVSGGQVEHGKEDTPAVRNLGLPLRYSLCRCVAP